VRRQLRLRPGLQLPGGLRPAPQSIVTPERAIIEIGSGARRRHVALTRERTPMRPRTGLLLIGMIATSGCYHATIDTGVTPSQVVVRKPWASGWLFGLVPPSTTATMAQCPAGVAKVETKLSFLNGLVSTLTMSIYTPMSVRVTCAAGPEAPAVSTATPGADSTVAAEGGR
jgi:hypothetical protein